MADDPHKRKAHVKRIFKSDAQGNIDDSTWIDVARFDHTFVDYLGLQDGETKMGTQFVFSWNDDPTNYTVAGDAQQENANNNRKTTLLKVKNPADHGTTQNSDDGTYINLSIVDKTNIVMRGGENGQTYINVKYAFNNMNPNDDGSTPYSYNGPAHRKTTPVRVVHNDLGGDKAPNMDQGQAPVDWEQVYLPALKAGTKDEGQYVDVEIDDNFMVDFGVDLSAELGGVSAQGIKFVLADNKPVEDLYKAPPNNAVPPPLRLDPLQSIVNVSWGGKYYILVWATTFGFGHTFSGTCHDVTVEPLPEDATFSEGVPFNPTITLLENSPSTSNAKIIYQRVEQIKTVDKTQYTAHVDAGMTIYVKTNLGTVVWEGGPNIMMPLCYWCGTYIESQPGLCGDIFDVTSCCTLLSGPIPHPCLDAGFQDTIPPLGITGSGFTGGYSDGPCVNENPIVGASYTNYSVDQFISYTSVGTYEQNHAHYEGVWLIEVSSLPKTTDALFSITVGGYVCDIDVLVYPSQGIKVDTSNTTSVWNFHTDNPPNVPTGRVYVPLNWSSQDNKPPNGPDGKPWPGYAIVGCPIQDVKNAVLYWGGLGLDYAVGDRTYKFVITKESHLNSPPPPPPPTNNPTLFDLSQRDVIVQIYLDDSSSGAPNDQFFSGRYCDVPYGLPFVPLLDPPTNRGPTVKIDQDVQADTTNPC